MPDICPKCGWTPPQDNGRRPGRPIVLPYRETHYTDCPTIPQISQECREKLVEMDRVRRRGAAQAHNYVIF